ncbi:hypothetical protein [Asticcacaulis endophyticus]|uniref:hypothetical protein n=1 Tax=Asticcacaulis endophyticus TaxID=1395890 RepID=UPI001677FEEF|nr:hypothetical protein [Asticcacaulis endophyticus]
MKYRLCLCLVLAMGWIYTVPQIYVGSYSPVLGNALYWASASAIYVTCAIALWVLLIRGRQDRAVLLVVGGLVFWGWAAIGFWKWIYFLPGQIYKTIWLYVAAFSPFWALASTVLMFMMWRSTRKYR